MKIYKIEIKRTLTPSETFEINAKKEEFRDTFRYLSTKLLTKFSKFSGVVKQINEEINYACNNFNKTKDYSVLTDMNRRLEKISIKGAKELSLDNEEREVLYDKFRSIISQRLEKI